MIVYRLLLGIDVVAALVAVYFFVAGQFDRSVTSYNLLLWVGLLGGIALILFKGHQFGARGQTLTASLVLLVLAAPAVLISLFILSLIPIAPKWR